MTDIFLSYSREDLATARCFAEGFEREGFTVWWDQRMDAGEAFDHVIEEALENARAVVVLWSTHSVQSRWVRAEATLADRLKKLVPVEIGPCQRPIMFELMQTPVLSHWIGDPAGALDIYLTRADLFRATRRGAALFDIWNPVMHDMRQLPGFKDLVREMGLVDYWRAYGWGDLCKPVGTDDFECT